MLRSEWLRRQLEQLGRAMTRLLGLKRAGQYAEAEQAANEAMSAIFGLSPGLVDSVPAAQLLQLLTGDPASRSRAALMLAELLRARADVQAAQELTRAAEASYLRALDLAIEATAGATPTEADEARRAVSDALAGLSGVELPRALLIRLVEHYERAGSYAKAEDYLFELVERQDGDADADALALGLAFYERLRAKSDGELEAGGLPRDEVEEGVELLRRRRAS